MEVSLTACTFRKKTRFCSIVRIQTAKDFIKPLTIEEHIKYVKENGTF